MPKAPNPNKAKARTSSSPPAKKLTPMDIYAMAREADSRKPKSAYDQYWQGNKHHSRILQAFIPNDKRVYGRPIAVVRGTTLGIPDGKTFGSVEQRKVDGIEDIMKESFRNKERAIMEWDGPDDLKAEQLRLAKQFTEESAAQEIWVNHPESSDSSVRYSSISDADGKPWLTFRWWSALSEASPAWYFDIVERASSKVLKPPKDLQMLNLWGSQTVVLDTVEYNNSNAHAQDVIENGKVHRVPIPIPEDRDERYKVAAGSTVVVLRDYQVVAHIQVPLVVF